ncbi:MAG: branched-chain amino acid ABC transporter permease [Anaerolineales bacterium]|nr:branched-chain amino acid ABC transporter permease [Anaerolineales bacterium]
MTAGRFADFARRYSTVAILIIPLLLIAVAVQLLERVVLERIVIVMFINLIMVLALQMFMGNSGVVSFGHIAFMGIGAYASVLLSMTPEAKAAALRSGYPFIEQLHLPFIPALLGGALITALVAAVIGFPLARLSGATAVIATFALLVIVHNILLNWSEVTNGPRIIFGIEGYTTLWVSVVFGLLSVLVAYLFKETALGLKLRASREDEQAAASIGINIIIVRWVAFSLSAFIAGLAGGLWAHFITIFSPISFYLVQTFLIVTMLIVGGMGSVSGAVVGTIAITAIFEGLRAIENAVNMSDLFPGTLAGFTEMLLAAAMIVLMIRRPAGITGGQEIRLPKRWTRRDLGKQKE